MYYQNYTCVFYLSVREKYVRYSIHIILYAGGVPPFIQPWYRFITHVLVFLVTKISVKVWFIIIGGEKRSEKKSWVYFFRSLAPFSSLLVHTNLLSRTGKHKLATLVSSHFRSFFSIFKLKTVILFKKKKIVALMKVKNRCALYINFMQEIHFTEKILFPKKI